MTPTVILLWECWFPPQQNTKSIGKVIRNGPDVGRRPLAPAARLEVEGIGLWESSWEIWEHDAKGEMAGWRDIW